MPKSTVWKLKKFNNGMFRLVVLNYILVGCPKCFLSFTTQIKKKLAENAKTSHPRAISSSFSQWTMFSYWKNRHCCFEVVNVVSLALMTGIMQLEITWALRVTRSLLVKYRCMSFYIKFTPCLSSTLQALINPPANIPESSRYSPNSN